jgi:hypothetical protein
VTSGSVNFVIRTPSLRFDDHAISHVCNAVAGVVRAMASSSSSSHIISPLPASSSLTTTIINKDVRHVLGTHASLLHWPVTLIDIIITYMRSHGRLLLTAIHPHTDTTQSPAKRYYIETLWSLDIDDLYRILWYCTAASARATTAKINTRTIKHAIEAIHWSRHIYTRVDNSEEVMEVPYYIVDDKPYDINHNHKYSNNGNNGNNGNNDNDTPVATATTATASPCTGRLIRLTGNHQCGYWSINDLLQYEPSSTPSSSSLATSSSIQHFVATQATSLASTMVTHRFGYDIVRLTGDDCLVMGGKSSTTHAHAPYYERYNIRNNTFTRIRMESPITKHDDDNLIKAMSAVAVDSTGR